MVHFNANQFSQTGPFESYPPSVRLGLVRHFNGKALNDKGVFFFIDWLGWLFIRCLITNTCLPLKKKKARLSGIDSRLIGKSFLLLLNVLFILSVVVIFN